MLDLAYLADKFDNNKVGYFFEKAYPVKHKRLTEWYQKVVDKAKFHAWFAQHRRYVEVFQLPRYWPELNATERIWNYTRKQATHNRFFARPQHVCRALFRTIDRVRRHPEEIANLIRPFC